MELVYEGNWNTYEEWGGVRIFQDQDDCFHVQYGGRSVYSSYKDPDWEEPYIISMETALEVIDEWDQIGKENEDFWNHNGGF